MKNIDVKSLLIGILATALLFACADADKTSPSIVSEAKAATGVNDKWDDNQEWLYADYGELNDLGLIEDVTFTGPNGEREDVDKVTGGWEPYAFGGNTDYFRKRIK